MMKGLKTIRTSNWDAMVQFYGSTLGMKERDGLDPADAREFVGYDTEIFLERVESLEQHELLGMLELYSVDPSGLHSLVMPLNWELDQNAYRHLAWKTENGGETRSVILLEYEY
ncbi:MAG: hypothetical protein P8M08_02100 [Akkermansiaceae bacterium]|nr:hypothetical protein [Akkermansiaceae bacterium]